MSTPTTLDDLRSLASEEEQEGVEAEAAGDNARAMRCYRRALRLRVALEALEAEPVLTRGKRSPKVGGDMNEAHREAISKAHLHQSRPMKAARGAGMKTLGDVATALGVSKSFVSQVFSGKKQMPEDKAREFEKRTGYPADRWNS